MIGIRGDSMKRELNGNNLRVVNYLLLDFVWNILYGLWY